MKSNFNLVRQFAVLSFVCIALITAGSNFIVTRFLTNKIVLRDATVSQEFLHNLMAVEGIWYYFSHERPEEPDPEIEEFFEHLIGLPDIERANVYDFDRHLLWSSDASLIGQRYEDNEELDAALSGQIAYEYGHVGVSGKQEHANLDEGLRFVETYIPVWNSDKTVVLGAVELYRIPSALNQMINEGRRLVWMTSVIGGIVLFASLFWIVRRASRMMEAQQRKLIESEALAMIGETASAIAHSMRNPLASIRASAELTLSDDLEGARESAHDIIHETDRLDQWARDLLHFSNLDAGQLEPVNLNDAISAVLDAQDGSVQRKTVEIRRELTGPLPRVHANAAPINQALTSLVANAVEATGDDGVVTVKTSLNADRRQVVVTIADNGPGLSEEMAEKVFRPFFSTKKTGTGLGLPLSRRIVEGYGGTLTLESAQGKGTTVTVSLPAVG